MRILVTGAAGFIGSELSLKLLERGETVIGIDNHNDYYDTDLKEARLARHLLHENYSHLRIDISDRAAMENAFASHKPQRVVNLAAQAGVRYSIENPHAYIQSNVVGFLNILESCRQNEVEHLVYASSSSVYGANTSMPHSVCDNVDHPLSVYAASKKSNELMAHAYSHLYGIPSTGLRFFTVYGPWGRPDMALFKFTERILSGKPIEVYNYGRHSRDFTYIDDIVEGVERVIYSDVEKDSDWEGMKPNPSRSFAPWRVYNIGNNHPINLMDFISSLEFALGKKATIELRPLQAGDVQNTHANVEDLVKHFDYKPTTSIEDGLSSFVEWYEGYYKVK